MRVATREDHKEILDMAMKFVATTGYKDYADEGTIGNLINTLLTGKQNEMIILLEPGVGMIGGMSSPFVFGPGLLASEVAMWVEEDKRNTGVGNELINAFEYWAKHFAGCVFITLTSLDDKVGKLYEKKGYALYERAYMKEL